MMAKPKQNQVDQQIAGMRRELLIVGFAVAKEIAHLRGQTSGSMACPLCQRVLRFSVAPNGHMHAKCETANCLTVSE